VALAQPPTTLRDVMTARRVLAPRAAVTIAVAVAKRLQSRRPRRPLHPEDIVVFEGPPFADLLPSVETGPGSVPEGALVRDVGRLLAWMLDGDAAQSADTTASLMRRSVVAGLEPVPPALAALVTWAITETNEPKSLEGFIGRLALLSPDADGRIGLVVGGAYRLLRVLGRGQMGTVFEAAPVHGASRVALKWIEDRSPSTDRERMERLGRRFGRELRSLRRVDHPNVNAIFEAGYDAALGAPWVVMELLVGHDLGAQIEREGALPAEVAVDLFAQAARGLAAAHDAGLVHRDVKPENLFLHREPDGAVVLKVCDFGLARLAMEDGGPGFTQSGALLGSLAYMAPEQIADARRADPRCDVYSLGITLYQALTGRLPHRANDLSHLYAAVLRHDVVPLRTVAPLVDDRLVAVVERAMAKDPAARFQSMSQVAAALEDLRRRPPQGRRLRAVLGVAALVAVSAAAIGIGAFVAVTGPHRESRAPSEGKSASPPPVSAAAVSHCIPEQDRGYVATGLKLSTVVSRAGAQGFRCSITRDIAVYDLIRFEHPTDSLCGVNLFYGDSTALGSMSQVPTTYFRGDAKGAFVISRSEVCKQPLPTAWLADEAP